mgnify:CR=1 FL=1|tara:strand:+ start:1470 stop:1970 length:501 start_codon:yes stop_codon:yes gene_type:complete
MNFNIEIKEAKEKFFKKQNIFFGLLILVIFIIDRITKIKVIKDFSDEKYFINDYINIDLIWNIGIGFGFLSTNSSLFYNSITFLIATVLVILFYFLIISKSLEKIIYAIIIGGALGNFYDRIIYRAVPDFLDIHYNNFHWFTFNVADIFISLGIFIFIIIGFFVKD